MKFYKTVQNNKNKDLKVKVGQILRVVSKEVLVDVKIQILSRHVDCGWDFKRIGEGRIASRGWYSDEVFKKNYIGYEVSLIKDSYNEI